MKDIKAFVLLILLLCGCENCIDYRGKVIDNKDIAQIIPNVSRLSDVKHAFGEPTLELDDGHRLMYISLKVGKRAFYLPRILEEHGYLIEVNNDNIVTGVFKMHLTPPSIICAKGETSIKEENMTFWQQLISGYQRLSEKNANTSVAH